MYQVPRPKATKSEFERTLSYLFSTDAYSPEFTLNHNGMAMTIYGHTKDTE